jgi:hypothetical protein
VPKPRAWMNNARTSGGSCATSGSSAAPQRRVSACASAGQSGACVAHLAAAAVACQTPCAAAPLRLAGTALPAMHSAVCCRAKDGAQRSVRTTLLCPSRIATSPVRHSPLAPVPLLAAVRTAALTSQLRARCLRASSVPPLALFREALPVAASGGAAQPPQCGSAATSACARLCASTKSASSSESPLRRAHAWAWRQSAARRR